MSRSPDSLTSRFTSFFSRATQKPAPELLASPKDESWSCFYQELKGFFSKDKSIAMFQRSIIQGETKLMIETDPAFRKVADSFKQALASQLRNGEIVALNLWNPMDKKEKFFFTAPQSHKDDLEKLQKEIEKDPASYEYLNSFLFKQNCIRPFILVDFNDELKGNAPVGGIPFTIIKGITKKSFENFLTDIEVSCKQTIHNKETLAERVSNLYKLAKKVLKVEFALIIPAQSTFDYATGGLIFFFRGNPKAQLKNIWDWWTGVSVFQQNFTSLVDKEYQRRHALRSALSAIIGRVTAHDLGHMLVNAKLPGDDAASEREPYFRHLVEYLRGRAVFAAEASTADPSWAMSLAYMAQVIVPFRSFIAGSVPKEYPSPVVRHIAESEGVKNINVRVLHGRDGECRELRYERDAEGVWLCNPYDIYVDVPAGVVGCHALYCILENVIRNGAKYGRSESPDMDLMLRLDTEGGDDWENEFVRVRVWDTHSHHVYSRFRTICECLPPACRPPGMERLEGDKWEIVDRQGALVSGGWGIKEMRIAAAWLRKESLVDALTREGQTLPQDENQKVPVLLRPIVVDATGERADEIPTGSKADPDHYMGYEFYLLKLQEALIVNVKDLDEQLRKRLSARGVSIEPQLKARDAGVEPNLVDMLGSGGRYYFCAIRLDDEKTQESDLRTIRDRRDNLPGVLAISVPNLRKVVNKPPASIVVGANDFKPLIQQLRAVREQAQPSEGQLLDEILKLYQRWIAEVLQAPADLSLVLHLNPGKEHEAPRRATELWNETREEFNRHFGKWKMFVHSGKGTFPGGALNPVIFDYHSVWRTDNPEGQAHQPFFHEPCGRNDPTQILLFNPPGDRWSRLRIALGLLEAAVARVAILDERIWKHRGDWTGREGSLHQALEQRKIFLPPESAINYEDQTHEQKFKKLPEWLQQNKINVLAIHQGMLDKMFDQRADVQDWIEERKKTIPFIIVESDRGEGLLVKRPSNARFAPFSSIEPWLRPGGLSKYHLIQTLFSSARGVHKDDEAIDHSSDG